MKLYQSLCVSLCLLIGLCNTYAHSTQKRPRIFLKRLLVQPQNHSFKPIHTTSTVNTMSFTALEKLMESRGDLVAFSLMGFLTANFISYIAIYYAIG